GLGGGPCVWRRPGGPAAGLAVGRGAAARDQDVPGAERRVLRGAAGRCAQHAGSVAAVPDQPRVAHRGELRAGADVRRPEHRVARRDGAAPGGVGPGLGEAVLAMTRALLIPNPAAASPDAPAGTRSADTLRLRRGAVDGLALP